MAGSPGVTLNLVRSEHELFQHFRLIQVASGLDLSQVVIDQSQRLSLAGATNLAPRIGGAWDVMGDGKLKLWQLQRVLDTMK